MPSLAIGIELRGEVPTCTFLRLEAGSASTVQDKHLKLIKLEQWTSEIVSHCAEPLLSETKHGKVFSLMAGPPSNDTARTVERLQRRRRDPRSDPELMARVAALYRRHPEAPIKAIAAEFEVSDRTAARWARDSSDAGLLPPAPKQGKKRI
jgi:hypothetical protein